MGDDLSPQDTHRHRPPLLGDPGILQSPSRHLILAALAKLCSPGFHVRWQAGQPLGAPPSDRHQPLVGCAHAVAFLLLAEVRALHTPAHMSLIPSPPTGSGLSKTRNLAIPTLHAPNTHTKSLDYSPQRSRPNPPCADRRPTGSCPLSGPALTRHHGLLWCPSPPAELLFKHHDPAQIPTLQK